MFPVLFLVALVFLAILVTILTEVEYFGWTTIVLLATVVGVQCLHVADIFHYVEGHVLNTFLCMLAYIVVGLLWSFAKWFSFLMEYRDLFRGYKESYLKCKKLDPTTQFSEEMLQDFKGWMPLGHCKFYNELRSLQKPKASENKGRIVAWMSLWPCSMVGTILNDPVRRLFNLLFSWFKLLYQKISDWIFNKDVELR